MSDMDYDSEEYDIDSLQYSCSDDSEPDVDLENSYYNAKSLKVRLTENFLYSFSMISRFQERILM